VLSNCCGLDKRNIKFFKRRFYYISFKTHQNCFKIAQVWSLHIIWSLFQLSIYSNSEKNACLGPFLDSFLSKSVNILQNQVKRAPFDIYSLFNHLSVLGGAPGSVPEPIHPLLPSLLSRFLSKRTANPPIETTKDHEKRNNSLNSRSIKMRF
jgi:hypothetical protein